MNIIKLFLFLFITLILNANEQKLQHVKLQLQWKHQFEFAGFYAAKEKGFYKDIGLDVEFIEFHDEINLVDEVLDKRTEYGLAYSSIVADYMNDKPIVMLANFFKQSPLVLITQAEITSLSQLKNATIEGLSNNIHNITLYTMLSKFGIGKHEIKTVAPSFNIEQFASKKVEAMSAFITNEPYLLNEAGIKYNIFDPVSYGAKYYDVNLFTSKEEVLNNPLRVKKFKSASIKGWEYALEHQEEIVELILQKYNTQNKSKKSLLFEAKQIEQIMLPNVHKIGSIDITRIKIIADNFIQSGFVKKDKTLNIDSFIYEACDSTLNLSKKEKEFLNTHSKIVLGTEKEWEPYILVSDDGTVNGYDADVLRLINEVSGANFTLKAGDWAKMQTQAQNRDIDGLSTGGVHKEREYYLNFSNIYIEMQKMLIVSNKNPNNIHSKSDLKDKIIAIHKSNLVDEKTAKQFPQAKIIRFDNIEDVISSVVTGEADAMFGNGATLYLANKMGMPYLKYAAKLPDSLKLAFGVRNDWPEAISIINKSLIVIGEHKLLELKDKWFFIGISKNNELTLQEKQYLKDKEKLTLCIDSNKMPFEAFVNGKFIGLNSDYLKLYEKALGIPITIYKTDKLYKSIEAVKSKKCDLLSVVMKDKDKDKDNYLNLSAPYLKLTSVIATKTDKFSILNISYLTNKKIAVIAKSSLSYIIKNNYPNIEIVEVFSTREGLNLVQSDKVYGFGGNLISVEYHLQHSPDMDIKINTFFKEKTDLRFGVSYDESNLVNILNKITNTISEDEKQNIMSRWFFDIYKKKFDYSFVYLFLILLIIVGIFIAFRHYLLKKHHAQLQKVIEDEVTKTREKEKLLFHQNKLAAMGEMLENIAHQWRQPLSQINSSVLVIDDILDDNSFKNIKIEEKLLEIESLTKYLSNTIDDFKDFFAQDKQKKIFNLRDTVEKALHIVKGNLQKHRIDTLLFIDENITYNSYENELQQVIVVILNNAKDAFIERTTLHPIIKISLEKEENFYILTICDNAGGITKAVKEKIFEPYFTTKHKSQGAGIGLYMSKKIIHNSLKGELSVTNSELGACFNIKLEIDSE